MRILWTADRKKTEEKYCLKKLSDKTHNKQGEKFSMEVRSATTRRRVDSVKDKTTCISIPPTNGAWSCGLFRADCKH